MRTKNNVVTAELKNRVLETKLKKQFSSGECVMRLSEFHEELFFLSLYERKKKNLTCKKNQSYVYKTILRRINCVLFVSFLSPDLIRLFLCALSEGLI